MFGLELYYSLTPDGMENSCCQQLKPSRRRKRAQFIISGQDVLAQITTRTMYDFSLCHDPTWPGLLIIASNIPCTETMKSSRANLTKKIPALSRHVLPIWQSSL